VDDVLKTYAAVVVAISKSPNFRAPDRQYTNEEALHVFDAGKRPLVAALLTIAISVREGRPNV
jgi:hypothetical protein